MNKVKIFLVIIVVTAVALAAAKYYGCGYLRDVQNDPGSEVSQIKEKISSLEKEKNKDARVLASLADQYTRLGTLFLEKRLWDQAIENYNKGLENGKNTPGIYYSIGLAYANRGSERNSKDDFDKAEFFYRKAIGIQDDYYDAKNALAILLFYHQDEKDKAVLLMEDVVSKNKKHYIARFTLGRFYYEMEQLTRSLAIYEDLKADLDKLPPSGIIEEYKKNCRDNIQRIMSELRIKDKK